MWDRYDPRDNDRDRDDGRERSLVGRGSTGDRNWHDERDPRDVFTKDLDLPRGRQRQPVRERERVYELDGTESRMLGTIGAIRRHCASQVSDTAWPSGSTTCVRNTPLGGDDRIGVSILGYNVSLK